MEDGKSEGSWWIGSGIPIGWMGSSAVLEEIRRARREQWRRWQRSFISQTVAEPRGNDFWTYRFL